MVVSVLRGRPRSISADLAITKATLELLPEVGYSSLTMAGVAERSGVSTATLYRRFAAKEDLVVGALTSLVLPKGPVDTGSLEADLHAILEPVAKALQGELGGLLRALSGESARHPALKAAIRAQLLAPFSDTLLAMLDHAVERGEIPRPAEPGLAVSVILGPLHHRRVTSDEPIGRREVDAVIPMLLRALGARP